MHNTGFTLVEILTAVVIVTILVAMAVPLYEKTIERSRLSEARTILAKLQDAKLRAMDNMGCTIYDYNASNCPKLRHLDAAFAANSVGNADIVFSTKDFQYSLGIVGAYPNGVCAKRLGGDNAGVLFFYVSPEAGYPNVNGFLCKGTLCEQYGLTSNTQLSCVTGV